MSCETLLKQTEEKNQHIALDKCNHPECIDGVRRESDGYGITKIYKCPYCVAKKPAGDWKESETAKRLKMFIDQHPNK